MKIVVSALMLFCIIFPQTLQAQELFVKSMQAVPMDLSASKYERKDFNGNPCALVKVMLAKEGATFEGNVLGEVEYKTGEYWVYLSSGTTMLRIKHSEFLPLNVSFTDYGISSLKSKVTYELRVLKASEERQNLTMKVSPAHAVVLIDSELKPLNNGVLTASLSVGVHNYVVTAEGYEPEDGTINIKAGRPSRIQIDLIKKTERVGSVKSAANTVPQTTAAPVAPAASGAEELKFEDLSEHMFALPDMKKKDNYKNTLKLIKERFPKVEIDETSVKKIELNAKCGYNKTLLGGVVGSAMVWGALGVAIKYYYVTPPNGKNDKESVMDFAQVIVDKMSEDGYKIKNPSTLLMTSGFEFLKEAKKKDSIMIYVMTNSLDPNAYILVLMVSR